MENKTSHNYINMRTRCGPCINHSVFNIQIPCAATGYTKHYFAGTERLVSAIGNGGLADVGLPIVGSDVLADKLGERDTVLRRVMEPYPLRINRNRLDTLYGMTYHKSHFTY